MFRIALQPGLFNAEPVKTKPKAFNQKPSHIGADPFHKLTTLHQDTIQFAGKKKRPKDDSSTSAEASSAGYYPSDSDSESEWRETQESGEISAELSATPTPQKPPYNLRKRPKKTPPIKPDNKNQTTPTNPEQDPPPSNEGVPPEKQIADIILQALQNAEKNSPSEAELGDSDYDDDPPGNSGGQPFQVISYKKSPFGPKEPKLGFKRIAGMNELKAELESLVIEPLKNPKLYRDYGLTHSANRVLLYGPPGCGKTFFSKALAEEAEANYMEIHPSAIASIYIHGTSQIIGDAFKLAAKEAQKTKRPTIVLIDEVDAVAPNRSSNSHDQHRNEEVAEFLNQLNESGNKNIFIVATTNRPDNLDPALIRSGRMNAKVYIGAPDTTHRESALKLYLKKRPQSEIDTLALAKKTNGYSMADLKELVNQAARKALKDRQPITMKSFNEALKTVHPSIHSYTESEYKEMIGSFEGGRNAIPEFIRHLYT